MTNEEAKKILACRGNGYSEEDFNNAIEVAFNCIPSLPANLDEAAEEADKLWDSVNTGHRWCVIDSKQDFLGMCLHMFELGLNAKKEDE